jgi:hypothetical protein
MTEATFDITGWEQDDYESPDERSGDEPRSAMQCPPLTRTGTFVIQHGAWEGGQWGFVVPGSGTGELAWLRGDVHIEHGRIALELT